MDARKWICAGLVALCWPSMAVGGDGRVEINQTTVAAGGGFPFVIGQPGSYVLTSDLIVPTDVDGLRIGANDVSLDLNGFRIDGPGSCAPLSCPTGKGRGIGSANIGVGQRVRVRDGTITGFLGSCVELSALADVRNMTIQSCGGRGIDVGTASSVFGNRLVNVGGEGLKLASTAVFGHNVMRGTALSDSAARAVSGGTASAGNVCEEGGCGSNGRRRYYLTKGTYLGAQAANPGNCAAGFHFASIWEVWGVSELTYATELGSVRADSGSGPPSQAGGGTSGKGWIRTGQLAGAILTTNGFPNCNAWASSTASAYGLAAVLNPKEILGSPPPTISGPWALSNLPCNIASPIWCIQD